MRILIETLGSRGDVQPYVALGRGLKDAGHEVVVCTAKRFENFVRDHGLGYAYLTDDLIKLLDSFQGGSIIEDMGRPLSAVKTGVKLLKSTVSIQKDILRQGWEAAQETQPDLIVYNSKMAGAHYADLLDVPAVLAMPFPQFVPTGEYPTIGFPWLKLGRTYNSSTYKIVHAIASRIGRKMIAEWRSQQGVPSSAPATGLLHRADGRPIPVAHAISPHVVPRPRDWPDTAVNTGYWFLDTATSDWQPPSALVEFLAAGDPPVYVGFGSMSGRAPERLAAVVMEALKLTGLRGILATGWGGLAPGDLPDSVFAVDEVPHDWLLPQVRAVVHHGGAGTTAAGLRAGCPTVICPFFGDQPFWGRRVQHLGVGSAPIPQRKLTAERLAAALREVTENPAVRQRAEDLGQKIRAEGELGSAVAFMESCAEHYQRASPLVAPP